MVLSTEARNAATDAVSSVIDTGSGTATVQFLETSTVLLTYQYAADSYGPSSGGSAAGNLVATTVAASATGTANTYRVTNRAGTVVDERPLAAAFNVTSGLNYTMNSNTLATPSS